MIASLKCYGIRIHNTFEKGTPVEIRHGWGARMAAIACAIMLALAAMAFAGCAETNDGGETEDAASAMMTVVDMRGRTVDVPQDVQRIVCVGISLRPVCYLQAVDKVVGVEESEHEDYVQCAYRHVNHATFEKLPVIGDGGSKGVTPNEEAIMKAAPQVIVADGLEADAADALQQKTGIPVVCLDQPETFFGQDYGDNLLFLGKVLGREERAHEVVDYIKDLESDLKARSAASKSAGTVSAYAAGISFRGGHGFDGTEALFPPFDVCGIANVADGQGANGPYSIDLEAVSSAQPSYVFIESGNLPLVKEDYASNPAYFDALNAVKEGKTYSLISYRFYSTNVELALANCYQVGSVTYPDTFSDVDPEKKLDEISEFMLGAPLSAEFAQKEGARFQQVDITQP